MWEETFDENIQGVSWKAELRRQEMVRKWGSYRVEAIHSKRWQYQKREQNDGCVYQCRWSGVSVQGDCWKGRSGEEQGPTFVWALSPNQDLESWTFFVFIPQAWWVMWYSPVTPQSRDTLSLFSFKASSGLPILRQPSFLQKMGLSPGKLKVHFTPQAQALSQI